MATDRVTKSTTNAKKRKKKKKKKVSLTIQSTDAQTDMMQKQANSADDEVLYDVGLYQITNDIIQWMDEWMNE